MPFGPAVLDGAREVGRIVFTTFTAALLSPQERDDDADFNDADD